VEDLCSMVEGTLKEQALRQENSGCL